MASAMSISQADALNGGDANFTEKSRTFPPKQPTMPHYRKQWTSLLFLIFLSACVAPYRPIDPLTLEYEASPDTLANSPVKVTYQYHVLQEAGNKKYARNERESRVSLLGVLIDNQSADTLLFPENFLIMAGADTLYPLYLDEADEALSRYHQYDPGTAGFWEWLFIYLIPEISLSAGEAKANKAFRKELDQYYLVFSTIAPGTTVSGLLALPVEKNTLLNFRLLNAK